MHFFHKKVSVVYMYVSILPVNSKYMPSDVCKAFSVYIVKFIEYIFKLSFLLYFHKNSESANLVFVKQSIRYILLFVKFNDIHVFVANIICNYR